MIEIGSMDRVTAVVGEKKMGKSTWAALDARVFQRETGGYVLVHSPRGQIGAAPDVAMAEAAIGSGLRPDSDTST